MQFDLQTLKSILITVFCVYFLYGIHQIQLQLEEIKQVCTKSDSIIMTINKKALLSLMETIYVGLCFSVMVISGFITFFYKGGIIRNIENVNSRLHSISFKILCISMMLFTPLFFINDYVSKQWMFTVKWINKEGINSINYATILWHIWGPSSILNPRWFICHFRICFLLFSLLVYLVKNNLNMFL